MIQVLYHSSEKRLTQGAALRTNRAQHRALQTREPHTCEAGLAGALVGVLAEHVAGTPILTGAGHKARVRGGVLAVLSCEPWSTSAGGFPQHGLRHTSTTILTAVFLTGVSMLTIFSQEAIWTSVFKKI